MAENIERYASIVPGLTKEHLGSHGHSQFAKKLDYILLANFFLGQFAHALLYGLLKDFWGVLLPPKIGKASLSKYRIDYAQIQSSALNQHPVGIHKFVIACVYIAMTCVYIAIHLQPQVKFSQNKHDYCMCDDTDSNACTCRAYMYMYNGG